MEPKRRSASPHGPGGSAGRVGVRDRRTVEYRSLVEKQRRRGDGRERSGVEKSREKQRRR
jgi:hypothetical protein